MPTNLRSHQIEEARRETKLAARLGGSRNTIRQAYRQLEAEGLLIHIPHHGVFVARLNRPRIKALYAFRRVAECGTLRALTADEAGELGTLLSTISAGRRSNTGASSSLGRNDDNGESSANQDLTHQDLAERNNDFHLAIVAASGSPELLKTAESVQAQLRLCFLSYPATLELHERFAGRHAPIAEALKNGDTTGAADLMDSYLTESFEAIVAALPLADD